MVNGVRHDLNSEPRVTLLDTPIERRDQISPEMPEKSSFWKAVRGIGSFPVRMISGENSY
jgi:hypothetical protein